MLTNKKCYGTKIKRSRIKKKKENKKQINGVWVKTEKSSKNEMNEKKKNYIFKRKNLAMKIYKK